ECPQPISLLSAGGEVSGTVTETLPFTSREVLGGVPAFPGSRAGGQARGFTSTRLLGRRAPARGIPMLWGRTCPAFAALDGGLSCCSAVAPPHFPRDPGQEREGTSGD